MARQKVFTCYECGDEYRVSDLSQASLDASGQTTKLKALAELPPYRQICAFCAGEWDDDDLEVDYEEDDGEFHIWNEFN